MKESWLTLQERQLTMLLRWWVGFFSAAAIGFAFFAGEVIYWLNMVGRAVFMWPYRSLSFQPGWHFWQVMSVSLLVVLTVVAFEAARDIRRNLANVRLIIVSKFVTAAGFAAAAFLDGPYFAYVAGAAIDLFIFAMTWYCYRKACISRAL